MAQHTYLVQQLPKSYKEGHQVPCVAREYPLRISAAHVLSSCAHSGRNNLACRVHQELGEPLEDFLDYLGIWLLEVLDGEVDADIRDAAGNLRIGLGLLARYGEGGARRGSYQRHEGVVLVGGGWALVVHGEPRRGTHARIVRHPGRRGNC